MNQLKKGIVDDDEIDEDTEIFGLNQAQTDFIIDKIKFVKARYNLNNERLGEIDKMLKSMNGKDKAHDEESTPKFRKSIASKEAFHQHT